MKLENKRLLTFLTSVGLIFISGGLASFNWFVMGNILWIEVVELILIVAGIFFALYHCDLWRQYERIKLAKRGNKE